MLGSKDVDTVNKSDVYDAYKDIYQSEKEREEKLLQGIQPANGLKARVGAKKTHGTALTVTIQENAIKKTFDKRFAIPSIFDFFKHPVYTNGLKEDLIGRLELNYSEKVILCTADTSLTYKLSDISLEYDAIVDESYATAIGEMYTRTTSIPYTKVTIIHYRHCLKKRLPGILMGIIFLFVHCRDYYYNFLINVVTLPTKMKNFTTQASRKF